LGQVRLWRPKAELARVGPRLASWSAIWSPWRHYDDLLMRGPFVTGGASVIATTFSPQGLRRRASSTRSRTYRTQVRTSFITCFIRQAAPVAVRSAAENHRSGVVKGSGEQGHSVGAPSSRPLGLPLLEAARFLVPQRTHLSTEHEIVSTEAGVNTTHARVGCIDHSGFSW
jgi:hypothetical protein